MRSKCAHSVHRLNQIFRPGSIISTTALHQKFIARSACKFPARQIVKTSESSLRSWFAWTRKSRDWEYNKLDGTSGCQLYSTADETAGRSYRANFVLFDYARSNLLINRRYWVSDCCEIGANNGYISAK